MTYSWHLEDNLGFMQQAGLLARWPSARYRLRRSIVGAGAITGSIAGSIAATSSTIE